MTQEQIEKIFDILFDTSKHDYVRSFVPKLKTQAVKTCKGHTEHHAENYFLKVFPAKDVHRVFKDKRAWQ